LTGVELREAPTFPAQAPAGPIPPDESWSSLECWIWQKLQAGAIANIDGYEDDNGRLPPADPRKPEDWQDGRRRLAPRFLEDLLLRETHRSGLHRKGVRIQGAWFADEIDLEWAEIACQICLEGCRFEQRVLLTGLQTPHSVSFDGSAFAADLELLHARISAQLTAVGAEFADVVLHDAKVGGRLVLACAKVAGTLAMESTDISQSLLMRSGTTLSKHRAEFNDVLLTGAKIGGQIALMGAKVAGTLVMDSAEIGTSLLMRSDRTVSEHRAEFNDVVLNSARIGGQLDLRSAKVAGALVMSSVVVRELLLMASDRSVSEHRAEFADVVLTGAKVGGQVALIGAKIAGTLNMDSADIGDSLLMASDRSVSEHRAEFNDVVLHCAKSSGQVSLIGAKIAGTLNMDSADIGDSLLMRTDPRVSGHPAEFDGPVKLIFAKVGRNVDLRGAVLSSLALTGTRIGGELTLASRSWSPQWREGGKLVLRNASADAIQDTDEEGAWPPALDLDGFTYRRLGGLGADAEAGVAKRGPGWFIRWLARDEPYTPQPSQQCAQVLREIGHPEIANAVLYAERERERKQAWRSGSKLRATGLLLLKAFVGYGYGQRLLWHPLAWVVALVVAGTVVLHLTGLPTELADSGAAVAYSLDTLLPIVELEKSFADIVLHGFAKYYFYFQKLMGWVLASFLIAGLSGLTK